MPRPGSKFDEIFRHCCTYNGACEMWHSNNNKYVRQMFFFLLLKCAVDLVRRQSKAVFWFQTNKLSCFSKLRTVEFDV